MAEQIEEKNPAAVLGTVGDSGLRAYGGYVTEEFLPELIGERGRAVFRRMATDPTVAALLTAVTALIQGAEITIQAADDSDSAANAKKWLEGVLFEDIATPLSDVVSEICTCFIYGWAALEVTLKQRNGRTPGLDDRGRQKPKSKFSDGKLGLHSLDLRGQSSLIRWRMDNETGDVLGMEQLGTFRPGAIFIPRHKFALFRVNSIKGNPESTSLLRPAYRPWFFKWRLEEIEAIGADRNNIGIPVLSLPEDYLAVDAEPAKRQYAESLTRMVRDVRRDKADYLVIPSSIQDGAARVSVSLLTPSGKTYDTGAIVARHDQAIARSVLAQFVFLGSGATGSFALSSDQTDLFAASLKQYAARFADVFNSEVIDLLWDANGFDHALRPTLKFGDFEKPDISRLISFVGGLVGAGAQLFPDRELENHLRGAAGLPLAPEEGQGADLQDQGMPGGVRQGEDVEGE